MSEHESLRVLHSAEEIEQAISRVAQEVLAHYGQEEEVRVLVLLNGALWFAADLLRKLPANYVMDSIRVSSYGDGMESKELIWKSDIPAVEGMPVLLLDDVLDTGKTLLQVSQALLHAGAKEVKSAVLVDKSPCRQVAYEADFVGLKTGDSFLLGFGLDLAARYRNLPYIAEKIL